MIHGEPGIFGGKKRDEEEKVSYGGDQLVFLSVGFGLGIYRHTDTSFHTEWVGGHEQG
ncbi:hypothetical protein RAC89_13930 [Paenibacillus sp. GD4]|uniref:hypothetical protein n=1 Tax=Paenibacillus sp. GD4 TaxID=3068890 RepID=UPI00279659AD|nr:hypothetical protein [Paenibacillus sp. GD4]MDQ1911529.1 hypothetical protein [Paenibacillus sp. GD4]